MQNPMFEREEETLHPPETTATADGRNVWKIADLNRRIKSTLEGTFGQVWVEGEISNFRVPASGHAYFTLKDATSQLRAVMFRMDLARVAVKPADGMRVRVHGAVTVYERDGTCQILVRRLEPAGEGELMLKLEALKRKLAAEGLFDASRKRPLPVLPQHVGVVTSPTGAAIRDILNVLDRRFANLHVLIAPARVQGDGAAAEIAAAIDLLNARGGLDVLIVGRGGGSLEDLWCFNEEIVVRAIARSALPVISAVGHEIDWTLSDYAADVRAPTPSAAAELVVRGKEEWVRRLSDARRRLELAARSQTRDRRLRLSRAASTPGLREPLRAVQTRAQQVDYLAARLAHALSGLPSLAGRRIETAAHRMETAARARLVDGRARVVRATPARAVFAVRLEERRLAVARVADRLRLLNPKAVLSRGYTLTHAADGHLLRSAAEALPGTHLITEFADGLVRSTVAPAEGEPHEQRYSGKEGTSVRTGPRSPRGNCNGNGKRSPRTGKNGGGVRGGAEFGQTLLFETE